MNAIDEGLQIIGKYTDKRKNSRLTIGDSILGIAAPNREMSDEDCERLQDLGWMPVFAFLKAKDGKVFPHWICRQPMPDSM